MTSVPTNGALSLASLEGRFRGRVIVPDHPDYDSARQVFAGDIDRRPAVIVRVADAADVAQVIALAKETGLELAVRSGGHSGAGHSTTDGGIVLDVRDLRGLEIDTATRTAWAGSGLTAGEYTRAAGEHGLATGFGDTASVGIGGITLSGGIGYLVRKHGLTIDQLLAAEVVTADGEVRRVDADTEPDLFWAIRGGAGNVGVVTRFQFRLHEVGTVYGGMLFLPATPETVEGFIAAADAAPEDLSTIANVMPAPPMPFVPEEHHGKLVIFALMIYSGPVENGEQAVAPFRALATPIADLLRPMQYPEIFPPDEGGYRPTAVATTMFLDKFDGETAQTVFEHLQRSDAPMRVAQIRALGGAMARVPVDATAFAHRQRRYMVNLASFYNGPDDRVVRKAWLDEFTTAMNGDGAYTGFLTAEEPDGVRKAYPGRTFERLAEIKRRYDPTNIFRLNHNVPPATG